MKQWLPIISLRTVITKRTRYRVIPSPTWSLLGDNYTLPPQTSGTPTIHNLSVESENIFFKAKLWYHISNSTMTKHRCLHIQSSNAWQTTDQNSVTLQNYVLSLGVSKLRCLLWVCAGTHRIAGISKTSLCILVSKVLPNTKQTPSELSSVWSLFNLCVSHTEMCVPSTFFCIYNSLTSEYWITVSKLSFTASWLKHCFHTGLKEPVHGLEGARTGIGGSVTAGRRAYSQKIFSIL
jgi:hypothetical protein